MRIGLQYLLYGIIMSCCLFSSDTLISVKVKHSPQVDGVMLCLLFCNPCLLSGSGDRGRQPHYHSSPEESRGLQNLHLTGGGQAQQGGCFSVTSHIKKNCDPDDALMRSLFLLVQIVTSASIDLQDYTYYFVAAPWLSVKLLRLLQCYTPPGMLQSCPMCTATV